MKKLCFQLAILFIVMSNFSFSQSDIPAFGIQQSPLLAGAGQIGASIPTKEVLGYYFNPAILGYTAKEDHASFFIMPGNIDWLTSPRLSYSTYGFNLGYNFKNKYKSLPLSLGFGFINNRMNNGTGLGVIDKDGNEINYYTGKDSYTSYSVGLGFYYFISLNLGLSLKQYNSEIATGFDSDHSIAKSNASGTAFDYGVMVLLPVSRLFFPELKYFLNENTIIKPKLDFTLGCSLLNIGHGISYSDITYRFPLPRRAKLGYTVIFGLDMNIKEVELEALKYSYTFETTDNLVRYEPGPGYHYQSIFRDINLWQNYFIPKSNTIYISFEQGHILCLFESLSLELGYFNGISSYGFDVSTEGVIKLLSGEFDNSTLDFIAKHIVLNFSSSYAFANYEDIKTNVKGLSINIKNFGL